MAIALFKADGANKLIGRLLFIHVLALVLFELIVVKGHKNILWG